ncbi:isoflavone reductase family protein [Moniliophthora roreri]|nr:isoflavone reductase family protein [Moniliophthora roreri]
MVVPGASRAETVNHAAETTSTHEYEELDVPTGATETHDSPSTDTIVFPLQEVTILEQQNILEQAREINKTMLQKYESLTIECRQLRSQVKEVREYKRRIPEATRENEDLRCKHARLSGQLDETFQELRESVGRAEKLKEENDDLVVMNLKFQQNKLDLEALKRTILDVRQRLEEKGREKEVLEIRTSQLQTQLIERNQRLDCADAEMARLKDEHASQMDHLSRENGDLRCSLSNVQLELREREDELGELKESLASSREELESIKNDKDILGRKLLDEEECSKRLLEDSRQERRKLLQEQILLEEKLLEKEDELEGTRDSLGKQLSEVKATAAHNCLTVLIRQFAQVRGKFAARRVSQDEVIDTCDQLGVQLVVIADRIEALGFKGESDDSDIGLIEGPAAKKRKITEESSIT